jgi:hypothetical protein
LLGRNRTERTCPVAVFPQVTGRVSVGQGGFGSWCPRQDSNLRTRLRRAVLYPLSYGGLTAAEKATRSARRIVEGVCSSRSACRADRSAPRTVVRRNDALLGGPGPPSGGRRGRGPSAGSGAAAENVRPPGEALAGQKRTFPGDGARGGTYVCWGRGAARNVRPLGRLPGRWRRGPPNPSPGKRPWAADRSPGTVDTKPVARPSLGYGWYYNPHPTEPGGMAGHNPWPGPHAPLSRPLEHRGRPGVLLFAGRGWSAEAAESPTEWGSLGRVGEPRRRRGARPGGSA